MSRTNQTRIEQVQLRFPCHKCHAAPNEWCTAGPWQEPASYLHSARFNEAVKLRLLPLKDAE